jgi:hypothetical protein
MWKLSSPKFQKNSRRDNYDRNNNDYDRNPTVMNAEIKDTPEVKQEKMESKPTRDDSNLFAEYDYNITLHINFNNEYFESGPTDILGDSAASTLIFNFHNVHLVGDKVPKVGAILGSGSTQLGAVTHEGVTTFMGVRVSYYIANITKSVVGICLLTSEFGFEVHIAGKVISIFATRSGERTAITINSKYLSKLPLTLFRPLQITSMMTTLNADSLYSL